MAVQRTVIGKIVKTVTELSVGQFTGKFHDYIRCIHDQSHFAQCRKRLHDIHEMTAVDLLPHGFRKQLDHFGQSQIRVGGNPFQHGAGIFPKHFTNGGLVHGLCCICHVYFFSF